MEHHGQLTSGMTLTSQPKVQQLISSFMLLGSLVGSFLSGPIGQKFGRRAGLLTAIVTSFIAISVMIGTTSVGALYFARILLGISNGIWMRLTMSNFRFVQHFLPLIPLWSQSPSPSRRCCCRISTFPCCRIGHRRCRRQLHSRSSR